MIAVKPPFTLRKILVPLDATAASVAAWKQAQDLAAQTGAQVQGLYVEPLDSVGELPISREHQVAVLGDLRRRLRAGDEEIVSVWGPVEGTIVSWTQNLDYDLVVMGTHARKGLKRLLAGSVAEAVVRESSIPVLVVRHRVSALRRILAPVCFEAHAQPGLDAAAALALTVRARLDLLHVVSEPVFGGPGTEGPKKVLEAQIARLPSSVKGVCRPKALVAYGEPAEQIAKAAENADLVVLSAHRRETLGETALGTTTERLLRVSPAAVLAVPVETREPAGAA